jgi:hypothetical protein
MAQSYNMARAYPQYWHPDTNPTVMFHRTGMNSTQNNSSDQWSQGPNGYPGMPPAGLGNKYNFKDPNVVSYPQEQQQHTSLPIHYRGPIPPQNYDATLTYAAELAPLRNTYAKEWLDSIDPKITALMVAHSVSSWNRDHNDTTPYYRTGSRYSQ